MILNENNVDSFSELVAFDEGLVDKITKSPLDYVFILSPEEWAEWLTLHAAVGRKLFSLSSLDERWKVLTDFAKKHKAKPSVILSILSAHPDIGRYKIGNLTANVLGNCCAVFFTPLEMAEKRAKEVELSIRSFKKAQAKKQSLS